MKQLERVKMEQLKNRKRIGAGIRRTISFVLVMIMLFPHTAYAKTEETENDFYMYLDASLQPTDNSGMNLKGNTPEVLSVGGFYATQGDWAFYPDSENDYVLTAENTVTHEKVQIADFLAANLNVIGDALVFTDVELTVEEGTDLYGTATRMIYGGNLYRVDGILSLKEESKPVIQQIGETDKAYYQVTMNRENIFALVGNTAANGDDWTYCKMDGMGMPEGEIAGGEGETIVNSAEIDGCLYLEIQKLADNGMNGGYILRIDRDNGTGTMDYIWGSSLRVYGPYLFFLGVEDGYLYEMQHGETQAKVISCCKIRNFDVYDNGLINGVCANGTTNIIISKESGLYPFSYCAVKQVGEWYNYLESVMHKTKNPKPTPTPTPDQGTGQGEKNKEPQNTPPMEPKAGEPEAGEVEQSKTIMTPETAVHMLYALIKGGSLEDPIFDIYDNNQKEEFIKYYNDGETSDVTDFGKVLANSLTSRLSKYGINESQIAEIEKIADGWLQEITYTCETLSYFEDGNKAYVRVHVTRSLDIENQDMSQETMMNYLESYMEENGYTMSDLQAMGESQMLYELTLYVAQRLPMVQDMDCTFDVVCMTHSLLGWVVDPGNEPGKGGQQIMDPRNGKTKDDTDDKEGFPPLPGEQTPGDENDKTKECPTSDKGCYHCVPREYIYVRKVHDTENLADYIIRQIKNSMIDICRHLPTTLKEKKKKDLKDEYMIYDDWERVDAGKYLPGVTICRELYLENLQSEPRSLWKDMWNSVVSWFTKDAKISL